MVFPEEMLKCRIVAAKSKQSVIVNSLYDLGLYHVTPHVKGNYDLDIGEPLAEAETIAELIVKIRHILSSFDKPTSVKKVQLDSSKLKTAMNGVSRMYTDYTQIDKESKELVNEKKKLNGFLNILKLAKSEKIDLASLNNSKVLSFIAGTVVKKGLARKLEAMNGDLSLLQSGKSFIAICTNERLEEVRTVINEFGLNQIRMVYVNSPLDIEINRVNKQILSINEKDSNIKTRLVKIEKELPTIAGLELQLREEIRKQELPLNFAVTSSSFIAEGWVPATDKIKIINGLSKVTNNTVHVEFFEPDKKEEPPVKLKHKRLVTPFEFLLRLYDLPKYKEIDPTSIFFFTFPLFFGFMLGDFVYGLVLFGVFALIRKKFPVAKQIAEVLMFAALVSMLFGIFFGEYMGFEHVTVETGKMLCDKIGVCLPQHTIDLHGVQHTVADFPRYLNRAHGSMNILGYDILLVLVIGAIIGFFHVNLGFILGFINEFYSHGFKHAFLAKLSWIILEIGIIMSVMVSQGWLAPTLLWPGIIIAVLGLVMLIMGEGIQGAVEIPALFSNMLSYMRLGAVGLASVGLAVVVNEELAMPFFERGGLFIFVGVLIMLLGHGVNILLGLIGPFLHSVRLHYVELFSKFFRGGGVEYEPFSKNKKNLTEEE